MDIERINAVVRSTAPAPLHQKLREAIQEQIVDGTLKPGETLPSERVMKEHFGVSRATVRQAVNALIQDGFLQSIPGTGTFVLELPVKSTASGLVGLITSSPNFNFFYPQLTAAFNQRIRQAGYGLVMALHSEHADLLEQMVDELLAQNVVALAITPPRYGSIQAILARLRRMSVPVVLIGRHIGGINGVDVVATDNETIGYTATRHLIDLGHRHIVHLGLLEYSTGDERAAGYRRAMNEAGLPPHIYQLAEETRPADELTSGAPREHLAEPARVAVHQIWGAATNGRDLPQPTAMFCFNDIVAMGAYKALRELQLAIPRDVSLISVDNLITVRHFEVPLSTFALPGESIGEHSAEILLRRLSGDVSPANLLMLPASFIPRSSTAPAPQKGEPYVG
jgi:GntR family transcriptional regulator of arabinose operon